MTFDDAINLWLESSLTTIPLTQATYRKWIGQLGRCLKGVEVEAVTVDHITKWLVWLVREKKQKSSSIIVKRTIARSFFGWLLIHGHVQENPVDLRKLPRLPPAKPSERRAITEEEHERIMAYLLKAPEDPRQRCRPFLYSACMIAWNTGMRTGDIAILKWEDIDFEEETINIEPTKTIRFGKRCMIPMTPELRDHLLAIRENPAWESNYVLPEMAGYYETGFTTGYGPGVQFRKVTKRLGMPEIGLHSYRHAFDSNLINSGVEALVVSAMTGHSVKMVKSYTQVSVEAMREAIEKSRMAMHKRKLKKLGFKGVPYHLPPPNGHQALPPANGQNILPPEQPPQ